ncbi:14176_t:CDS:2 [Cetraspora pellucida]|uniref:14176_t:CDS:1 n=1 Tax=Cetraspora pellucida TaxID=1433469 RepID=A0ACA9LGS3_9GLOM|nr:14176_t:CDS:2 [Cetraspora pellucida]
MASQNNKKKKLKTNKENVSNLEADKMKTTDNSQKEKLVLKEVLHKNLASWDEQVESEIKRTKAFLTQDHREGQTDTSKENNNTKLR